MPKVRVCFEFTTHWAAELGLDELRELPSAAYKQPWEHSGYFTCPVDVTGWPPYVPEDQEPALALQVRLFEVGWYYATGPVRIVDVTDCDADDPGQPDSAL